MTIRSFFTLLAFYVLVVVVVVEYVYICAF